MYGPLFLSIRIEQVGNVSTQRRPSRFAQAFMKQAWPIGHDTSLEALIACLKIAKVTGDPLY